MKMTRFDRLPTVTAMVFVVLIVAACTVRLRGDEEQTNSSASVDRVPDPLATKLAECRSVNFEQKEALSECRKAWAEKRRQFLGEKAPSASSDSATPRWGSSLFVLKNESGVLSGYPSIQQSGKE